MVVLEKTGLFIQGTLPWSTNFRIASHQTLFIIRRSKPILFFSISLFTTDSSVSIGLMALVLFQVSQFLLLVENINENRTGFTKTAIAIVHKQVTLQKAKRFLQQSRRCWVDFSNFAIVAKMMTWSETLPPDLKKKFGPLHLSQKVPKLNSSVQSIYQLFSWKGVKSLCWKLAFLKYKTNTGFRFRETT